MDHRVPFIILSSNVAHPSVGTTPTAYNNVTSETTSTAGIGARSGSGHAK